MTIEDKAILRLQEAGGALRLMIAKIARVFPRKTQMSPDDELAFFDTPPLLTMKEYVLCV